MINKRIKISFDNMNEMDRAFEVMIHESDHGFSGIGRDILYVPKEIIDLLNEKGIKFTVLE